MQRRVIGSFEGRDVEEVVLSSREGVRVAIMTYGAAIRDWQVPVGGTLRSVTLGFDDFDSYPKHSPYFGAVAGRVANRTAGAAFMLDGRLHRLVANEGSNHLHGGPRGVGKQVWRIEDHDGASVKLSLESPYGDMGYPGALAIAVRYRLTGHRLEITFTADPSCRTPVNLVQHNYFNLMGRGDVLDHRLKIEAGAYTPVGEGQVATGAILPVDGTSYDFRTEKTLRDGDGEPLSFDHNLVLDTRRDRAQPAAILTAPDGSLSLRLFTDQPGIQVYNGWKLNVPALGLAGARYEAFGGVCLEDQNFPGSLNHAHFPNPFVEPGAPYRHRCAIEIG
ncbi:aldose epimerase family protein [Nitratireductor pacificus]|uniref:Aldose 1-epimerase n=1 Tax=Nitratireductor pacificus pht-3B TaxID=391937 RepID=K2M919_9HYPH|nr:aldose epimerase family protein [Nitratireductor pacificus]EKF18606.1 aldose 1-epimerase [Nitratireductor pacificus pht-3B]